MSLEEFALAYLSHFRENIDAASIGFDDGLLGFLIQLKDMVMIDRLENGTIVCSLSDKLLANPSQSQSQRVLEVCNAVNIISNGINTIHNLNDYKSQDTICNIKTDRPTTNLNGHAFNSIIDEFSEHYKPGEIFDPNNQILWGEKHAKLLERSHNLLISLSPFELAHKRNPPKMRVEENRIRRALSAYPNGLPLNFICTIISLDKRLFNAPSIATIIEETPELFYIKHSHQDDKEPTVFDGHNHTYDDLSGNYIPDTDSSPSCIAFLSIVTGLYQKTILLVRKAEPDGLKLSTWLQSLQANFPEDLEGTKLYKVRPLTLFLALKNVNLIDIRSHKNCLNDLRLHLPDTNKSFIEKFITIGNKLKLEREHNKQSSED